MKNTYAKKCDKTNLLSPFIKGDNKKMPLRSSCEKVNNMFIITEFVVYNE